MKSSFLPGLPLVAVSMCWLATISAQSDSISESDSVSSQMPAQIQLGEFPASMMGQVIVPNPGELFSLLEKLPGPTNWRDYVRASFEIPATTDRTCLALTFGILVADGFIAVQAKDSQAVGEAGRKILDLSENLNLKPIVMPHCLALFQASQNDDWALVREELDLTHLTVRRAMKQMRDEDLAHLISMAGWLRGTDVLTEIISKSYSPVRAEILYQPQLAAHFIEQIRHIQDAELNPRNPHIQALSRSISMVKQLMDSGTVPIPFESVALINSVCSQAVKAIVPE